MPLIRRGDPFVCTFRSQYATVHFAANLIGRGYKKVCNGRLEPGTFTYGRCREGWLFEWLERPEDDREDMAS